MEIHHRFMNISTTGINLLLDSIGDNCEATITRLVNEYSEKIRDGVVDVKTLEGLRAILCHQYQSLINSNESLSDSLDSSDTDIKSFFVKSNESWNNEELSLLYDILVLRFVLRSNVQHFVESFKRFYETQDLQQSNEKRNIHMGVSECFADCHNLRLYLRKKSCDKTELERQRGSIETAIILWIRQEENLEWRLLASLLPKLAIAFGYDKIVTPLWNEVFDKSNDLEKTLASLCVMADVCFPSEKEMVKKIHYEQCVQQKFWSIIQKGLLSGVFQHRKQALYLAKRAVDFVGTHESSIRIKLQQIHENIVPFVCTRLPLADLSVEKTKKSFFLLLEVLEEKQKHLVLPALSYLSNLIEAYNDHLSCGDCFNVVWLHCILKRILLHDNDEIKLVGLEVILQADLGIFDDSFLDFIATILNNTFLYDYDRHKEEHPRIVEMLWKFFQRAESARVPLINAFVRTISKVSWGPVALYWVLISVIKIPSNGPIVYNIWTTEELKSIAILVPKIVTMSCLQLRTVSLYFILIALTRYFQGPLNQSDFEIMMNTQSSCFAILLQPSSPMIGMLTIVDWLNMIKSSDAVLYITKTCNTFFTRGCDIETLALNIALLLYSMRSKGEDIVTAKKALHCLLQNLNDANNRLYADPITISKVFKFVSHLIHNIYNLIHNIYKTDLLCGDGKNMIKDIVSPYRTTIIELLNRSLGQNKTERYDEYLLALRVLIDIHSPANSELRDIWWPDMEKHFEVFEDKCIAITAEICSNSNYDLRSKNLLAYVLKVLYLCRERTCSRRPLLEILYMPRLLLLLDNEAQRNFDFALETIAKIMRQFITKLPPEEWPTNIRLIEKIQSLVEIGREEMIESIAAMLYELLEKNPPLIMQDLSTVHSIIRQSFRCAFQMRRDKGFFATITQLTRLIVNSKYLIMDGAKEYAIEFVTEMLKEGERVPTIKRIFLASMKTLGSQDVLVFHDSLISCLLHGAVPRRDQRIEQIAIKHSVNYDDSFKCVNWNIHNTIRAEAIVVLLRIMTSPKAALIRSPILMDLLRILEQNKNKRYFDNSQLHRLKHRVMQTLLILEPFLSIPERKNLHDNISGLLIAESNQPSVRLMQEWILSRIYINNNTMRELIWDLFATALEKRPGSIVSLAGIVYHVSQSLHGKTQSSYITKAIQYLLPNCMGQHFNVRLYSQEILGRLYKMAPVSSECRQIYEGIEKSYLETLKKSSIKVFDNFYFTDFAPIASYTFENIYHELPRLTNVCSTEWICPQLFKDLEIDQIKGIEPLLQSNTDDDDDDLGNLTSANPMLKSTKATGELVEDIDPLSDTGLNDIQKKIIPWKSMVPFYDDLSEAAKAMLSCRKIRNEEAGIIVVASLIDRPPNLGGLARTCEIFGAKELVIRSLRYAEDREFRTLSVSAEKWITMTEVKPYLLKNYLLEKQSEGWNLVGAEQTANSVNLLEMKFDKKTILLLGNEKDGIPASLIPLLNKCVEIPQNGVVRSLNVHVTGAICIWQYAKQHILT